MTDKFDIEDRWPELFEGLDARQRRSVVQTLASSWHEGWQPNREDVADLADFAAGRIDFAEFSQRGDEKAKRARAAHAAS